jgi:hypothetical protein
VGTPGHNGHSLPTIDSPGIFYGLLGRFFFRSIESPRFSSQDAPVCTGFIHWIPHHLGSLYNMNDNLPLLLHKKNTQKLLEQLEMKHPTMDRPWLKLHRRWRGRSST